MGLLLTIDAKIWGRYLAIFQEKLTKEHAKMVEMEFGAGSNGNEEEVSSMGHVVGAQR